MKNNLLTLVNKKHFIFICLFFVIVIGFLLRLIIIQRDLYFDEVFSTNISQLNFKDINQNVSQDILHVPFYYYILHCWLKMFGDSDINIRLLSVIFGLLSILIIYLIGKIFYNLYVGLIAALLLSLSSLHLVISQEARMYSLVFFLSLLSIYFFWRGFHENKKIFWIAYLLFTILAIYTHYQAWFLLAAQNIFFIIYNKKYSISLLKWILMQGVIFLFFSPWFILSTLPRLVNFGDIWLFHLEGGRMMIFAVLLNFVYMPSLIDFKKIIIPEAVFYTISFALLFFGIFKIKIFKNISKKLYFFEEHSLIFLMLLLLISLFVGFAFSVYIAKYFIVASIPVYLLIAKSIYKLKNNYMAIILPLIIILSLTVANETKQLNQHIWQEIAGYVQHHEERQEKVIVYNFHEILTFLRYYHGQLPAEGLLPENLSDLDINTTISRYNFQPVINENNVNVLSDLTNQYKRIWYVNTYYNSAGMSYPLKWFSDNKWDIIYIKEFNRSPIKLILYEK